MLWGAIFAAIFAFLTVYFENRKQIYVTATQIAVLPYVLLFLSVLLINPLCRLIRVIRPFSAAEVLLIFIMGSVSAGISTFGLASQLVPMITSPFNRHWNNDQSEWERYLVPFVVDTYFVAHPGIRNAAIEYREAVERRGVLRHIFDAAVQVERANGDVLDTQARVQQLEQRIGTSADGRFDLPNARQLHQAALQAKTEAEAEWQRTLADPTVTVSVVIDTYPQVIRDVEMQVGERKAALRKLEQHAFAKVDTFRRGLPDDLRAFPGFVPLPGESYTTYSGRLRRLTHGLSALRSLQDANLLLAVQVESDAVSPPSTAPVIQALDDAIDSLSPVSDPSGLIDEMSTLETEWSQLADQRVQLETTITRLSEERRFLQSGWAQQDKQIAALRRQLHAATKRDKAVFSSLGQAKNEVHLIRKVAQTVQELQLLREDLAQQGDPDFPVIREKLETAMQQFRSFDASWARFIIGDVPWSHWIAPVLRWFIIIGLTYLVLLTFNVLIFRQWAHHEKLQYPLAQLPEILVNAPDDSGNAASARFFGGGAFWIGFSVSAAFLGWNVVCYTDWVPGLTPLDLNNHWGDALQDSSLTALVHSRSAVFFTMIGLAFLIPAKVSFSIWFFYVLYLIQLQAMVWAGFGVDERSFPAEILYTLNFRTAEGGGALMVFALVVLYKCRNYIFCCCNTKPVEDLNPSERKELRLASLLFLLGSIGLILTLWLGLGANLFYTIFTFIVIMIITIGLIRMVAEGGILGLKCWFGPFHLIRSFPGMDKAWTAPTLFAPLLVYYSIIFMDIKTFIAPAMANGLKIRDDLKMERLRFHLAIVLGIVVAAITGVGLHIIFGYSVGADAMSDWFYTGLPKGMYTKITYMMKTTPVDETASHLWFLGGAGMMSILLFCRQFFFSLPHPIGLIMLVNPIMQSYWFSILLGWLAKSMVSKYGNIACYEKVRNVFIGLIVGELTVVVVAMVLSYNMGVSIPIDLNRN